MKKMKERKAGMTSRWTQSGFLRWLERENSHMLITHHIFTWTGVEGKKTNTYQVTVDAISVARHFSWDNAGKIDGRGSSGTS